MALTLSSSPASEKNDSISFDSADIKGILLLNIFLKLAELAALPRRALFQIISYYQQTLRDYTGQKVGADGDLLKHGRKKRHNIRKEKIYSNPTSARSARVSTRKKRKVASYVEHLKDSPYAQVPIFPLISEQNVTTRAKRKKGLQKVARQRNKPTTSLESHIWVQERETSNTCVCEDTTRTSFKQAAAPKPHAPCRKQRRSPDINNEHLNTRCHLTTGCVGKTQAQVSVKRGGKMSPFAVRGQQLGQD
ncbi:EF-hand calcium-binding domain-containing protein 3 [Porphyrio hochstetteri]